MRVVISVLVVTNAIVAGVPVIVVERLPAATPSVAQRVAAIVRRRHQRPFVRVPRENRLAGLGHFPRATRVAAVERVVNLAIRRRERESVAGGNRATVLAELRRVFGGLNLLRRHLVHDNGAATRYPGSLNMRTEISQNAGHFLLHFAETAKHILVGQRATVEVVNLHPVGKTHPKLRILLQCPIKNSDVRASGERTAAEVVAGDAAAVVAERPLGVPHKEAPFLTGHALACGTPVVVRPVAGVRVHVEHDVVDEIVDVQQPFNNRIVLRDGEIFL